MPILIEATRAPPPLQLPLVVIATAKPESEVALTVKYYRLLAELGAWFTTVIVC